MPGINGEKLRRCIAVTHFTDTINRAGNWYAYIAPSGGWTMNFRILEKTKYTEYSNLVS